MKKVTLSLLLAFAIGLLSCHKENLDACCSCNEKTGTPRPYIFPSATEYRTLAYLDKLKKLQIPDQTVKQLCTFDLVETYFTYPLLSVLTHSNNFKSAFDYLVVDFNGARELVNREDGATQLIKRHQSNNFTNFDLSWELEKQYDYKWNLMLLELTLSQDQFLSRLKIQSKNELLRSAMAVLERRVSNSELFTYTNNSSNDFLIANVLFSTGYLPFSEYVQANPNVSSYLRGYMEGTIGDKERLAVRVFANDYLETLPR